MNVSEQSAGTYEPRKHALPPQPASGSISTTDGRILSDQTRGLQGAVSQDSGVQLSGPSLADRQAAVIRQAVTQARQFGTERGRLLADSLVQSEEKKGHGSSQMLELEQAFYRSTAALKGPLPLDPLVIPEIAHDATVNQARAFIQSLYTRFVELGTELGHAQGKEIDSDSLHRVLQTRHAIELRVRRAFAKSGQEDYADQIIQACYAGLHEGESLGIEQRVRAESDAATVCRLLKRWTLKLPIKMRPLRQLEQIESLLLDRSHEELRLVNGCVRAMLGKSLLEALIDSYGKGNTQRVKWITDADPLGGRVVKAARGLSAWFATESSRSECIRQAYGGLNPQDIARFEGMLAARLHLSVEELDSRFASTISKAAYQQLLALRAGDAERALALHIEEIIHSPPNRQPELRHIFKKFSPQDVQEVSCLYEEIVGRPLFDDVLSRLANSPTRDLCLAILESDEERVKAAKVRCAFHYRSDFIGKPFINKSAEERAATISAYNRFYHQGQDGIWSDLRQACFREDFILFGRWSTLEPLSRLLSRISPNSHPFFESILKNGEVSKAELLKYYMAGPGADIRGILSVLAGCTAEEVPVIKADFARIGTPHPLIVSLSKWPVLSGWLHNGDLAHDLAIELSGDHEFDVSILLAGVPDSDRGDMGCKTLYKRLHQRFLHEQSGRLLRLFAGQLTRLRGESKIALDFHADYQRAVRYYREQIEPCLAVSKEHAKRFTILVRHFDAQADAFRACKQAISSVVLNSGAALGATTGAAIALMVAAIPWWYAPIASGFGSLLWRWGQGRLVLGRGFGRRDANFQAIRAFIDGSSMFTIKLGVATLGGLLGRQLSSFATKGSVKSSMHKVIELIEQRLSFQSKAKFILDESEENKSCTPRGANIPRLEDAILARLGEININALPGSKGISEIVQAALR